MKNLAVIPARSGSKGVKDKNIRVINGKPLMAYSIQAAQQSGLFSSIMVSTDSTKYADIAIKYGAEVPFMRSKEMSADNASSWDTLREVLKNYSDKGEAFDTVCLLQPTSPLRLSDDIIEAYSIYRDRHANSVVSICESDHSPLWMNILPENKSLDGFLRTDTTGRHGLEKYYRINGAIYVVNAEILRKSNNIYQNSFAYIMPIERSIDVDTEFDIEMTEFLLKRRDKK